MSRLPVDPACREQRRLFFHLRRDELDEVAARDVRAHLDGCADCRRFDEVEAGFDAVLASSLAQETVPDDLRARIRSGLDEAQRAHRPPGRRPWIQGLAAAALLAVGMLIPGVVDRLTPGIVPSAIAGQEVEWTGVMVDDECDRHGMGIDYQRDCAAGQHHTVFKSERGEYISLVPGEVEELPVQRQDRGVKLRVRGRYNRDAGTLTLAFLERL